MTSFVFEVKQSAFLELFEDVRKRTRTQEDAYEICELVHEKLFNSRKYSDFQSFRAVFNRHTHRQLKRKESI